MKFLLDAHFPQKLALFLRYKGYDALHTLDLLNGNRSKDSDFIESLLISNKPYKLLYINTGNIKNKELQVLIGKNINELVGYLEVHRFVELTDKNIIIHG